jgi:hypothetical protein
VSLAKTFEHVWSFLAEKSKLKVSLAKTFEHAWSFLAEKSKLKMSLAKTFEHVWSFLAEKSRVLRHRAPEQDQVVFSLLFQDTTHLLAPLQGNDQQLAHRRRSAAPMWPVWNTKEDAR